MDTDSPDSNAVSARKSLKPLAIGAGVVAGAAGAAAAGWIAWSKWKVDHSLPLPDAVDGRRRTFYSSRAGKLSYYEASDATGRPLVLLHSVNAAASAFEMRPLFDYYRGERPVFALDLPGFGHSDRSARLYTPDLYAEAIAEWIARDVKQQEPVDVVALSLTSEFVCQAAIERPGLFRSITLISPTGFDRKQRRGNSALYSALTTPAWSQAFYDLVATRASIRYYLNKSFSGAVDAHMVDYAYATSHQPGARNAPLYFISGQMFTPAVREDVYALVKTPALVLYDKDPYVRFDALDDFAAVHRNWSAERIPGTLGLPHFERLEQTVEALDEFWQRSSVAFASEPVPDKSWRD